MVRSNTTTVNATVPVRTNNVTLALLSSSAEFHVYYGFTLAVCVAASLLILLLLASSFPSRNTRLNASSRVLTHLLVCQLLLCGVLFPIQHIRTYYLLGYVTPNFDCRPFMLAYMGVIYTENWVNASIACNRFVAIELPHTYRRWWMGRPTAPVAVLAAPWLLGLGLAVPIYFGVGADFVWNGANGLCFGKVSGPYLAAYFALVMYLPMALIGVLYGVLFVRLLAAARPRRVSAVREQPNGHQVVTRLQLAKRVKVARMLMVSFAWYCLCFTANPVIASNFPGVYARDPILQLWLSKTLTLCGHAATPVISISMSEEYQSGVKRLLWRVLTGKHSASVGLSANAAVDS